VVGQSRMPSGQGWGGHNISLAGEGGSEERAEEGPLVGRAMAARRGWRLSEWGGGSEGAAQGRDHRHAKGPCGPVGGEECSGCHNGSQAGVIHVTGVGPGTGRLQAEGASTRCTPPWGCNSCAGSGGRRGDTSLSCLRCMGARRAQIFCGVHLADGSFCQLGSLLTCPSFAKKLSFYCAMRHGGRARAGRQR